MDRRQFIGICSASLAGLALNELYATGENVIAANIKSENWEFPIMDLHVHCSKDLTIENIVDKSRRLNMKIGVMENIAPWGITCDSQLKEYIDNLRPYPVYIGLQPMSPGWSKNFSTYLIDQADYIVMDPQIVEKGNTYGETILLWEYTAYIDDVDYFMERNMQHYLDILTGDEPLDVFACPFFLPACIQREYHSLWTKKRQQQVIDAARSRNIAIEINDTMHVPHKDFILMAKKAGLKFTFGSDSRNHTVGRLAYCKHIAKECQLTEKDFFIPRRYR